jgi:hypothetical protein
MTYVICHRQSIRGRYCDPVSFKTFPAIGGPLESISLYARAKQDTLFTDGTLIQNKKYRQTIFLLKKGTLHQIPNFPTFLSMGFDSGDIRVLTDLDFGTLEIADALPSIS